MPKISIIIPILNQLHYTKQIISEIKNKCVNDYELIIINDGSTDDTLTRLAQQEGITIITHDKTRGVNYSWNEGVEKAHGEYIWIINNDILLTDKLDQTLLDSLDRAIIACPWSTTGMCERKMPVIANKDNICGRCYMLRKSDRIPIPNYLHTRYGDNRIYEHYKHSIQRSGLCHHYGSQTLKTIDHQQQVQQDQHNWGSKYITDAKVTETNT